MIEPTIITTVVSCIGTMLLLDKFFSSQEKKQEIRTNKVIQNEGENITPRKTWVMSVNPESDTLIGKNVYHTSAIFQQSFRDTERLLKENQQLNKTLELTKVESMQPTNKQKHFSLFDSIAFLTAAEQFLESTQSFVRASDSSYVMKLHPFTFTVITLADQLIFHIESSLYEAEETIFVHSFSHRKGRWVSLLNKLSNKYEPRIDLMLRRVKTEFSPVNESIYTNYPRYNQTTPHVSMSRDNRIHNWRYQTEYMSDILANFVKGYASFVRTHEGYYLAQMEPFSFAVRLDEGFIYFGINWKNSEGKTEELFKYEYTMKTKRGRIWLDKLPLAFPDTLGMISYIIEEFYAIAKNETNDALELSILFEHKDGETKEPNTKLWKLWEEFKKDSSSIEDNKEENPVEPAMTLPSNLQKRCKEIETLALSIEVNDGFEYLPIDIKHRFETLGNDYDKLIHSYHATSDASMEQKEETVLNGLDVILDKFQEIYTLIGELEHKDFLRQVRTIEQR